MVSTSECVSSGSGGCGAALRRGRECRRERQFQTLYLTPLTLCHELSHSLHLRTEQHTGEQLMQWNLYNQDTNGAEVSVIVSEVSLFLHARVVLGVGGNGVLFREVSSALVIL